VRSLAIIVVAAAAWGLVALAWLRIMPNEARAKTWHYIHAFLPFIILILYAIAPAGLREPLRVFLFAGLLVFLIMAAVWSVGEALRNHGIMDVVYPIVPAAVGAFALSQAPVAPGPHSLVLFLLVLIWAVRLAAHTAFTCCKACCAGSGRPHSCSPSRHRTSA
jgi:hypothetical protein